MTFSEYQKHAKSTAIYPDKGNNITYPLLGLAGETGEVFEKFKKIIRDKGGTPTQEDIDEIKKELGDVLWYLSTVCTELKINLGDVAELNVSKLKSRQKRNRLHGSGDNR